MMPGLSVGGGGLRDPFSLTRAGGMAEETGHTFGITSIAGKSAVANQRPVSGERNLVFILAGQSNAANYCGTSQYAPTNGAQVQELSVYDGAIRAYQEPLTGAGGFATNRRTWFGEFADNLIDGDIADRVIAVPVAIGDTFFANWSPGGICWDKMLTALRRVYAQGHTPSAVLFQAGESDGREGTSEVDCTARLNAMIAGIRTDGHSCPIFISTTSWTRGAGAHSAVTNAQAAVINHGNGVWAGPNTDAYTGDTYRNPADDHFNNAACALVAADWQTALAAYGAPFT